MLLSSLAALLLAAILIATFPSVAMAQQQPGATTTTTTPTSPSGTMGQTTTAAPAPTPSTTAPLAPPLTPQEQEQQDRLQRTMAATTQNLEEAEKQVNGVVYTPRWSNTAWIQANSLSVLIAYCLPGEFAESGQEILGGPELELLESYPVALPGDLMIWMMVVQNEDGEQNRRLPAAAGVICASDINETETRVLSPGEQQQLNNIVQQFTTQVTNIDQVINIINNVTTPNGNTTTTAPPTTTPGNNNTTNPTGGADTTPPVLTVPENIVTSDDRTIDFPDGNVVPYAVTARDDVDGSVELLEDGRTMRQDNVGGNITIFCLPASLSFFPIADTTVQCTAIDEAGNRGEASFTVSVTNIITPQGSPPITASLSANPATYEGPCPALIEFSGTITDNVGNRDVTYRFLRGDGGAGPEQVIHFDQPGSQSVSTTLRIVPEDGWVAIEILQPVQLQSNQAYFDVTCTPQKNPYKQKIRQHQLKSQ